MEVGFEVCDVRSLESADVPLLLIQALNDSDAGDIFLEAGVDFCDGCADSHEGSASEALPYVQGDEEDGDDGQGDER